MDKSINFPIDVNLFYGKWEEMKLGQRYAFVVLLISAIKFVVFLEYDWLSVLAMEASLL